SPRSSVLLPPSSGAPGFGLQCAAAASDWRTSARVRHERLSFRWLWTSSFLSHQYIPPTPIRALRRAAVVAMALAIAQCQQDVKNGGRKRQELFGRRCIHCRYIRYGCSVSRISQLVERLSTERPLSGYPRQCPSTQNHPPRRCTQWPSTHTVWRRGGTTQWPGTHT